MGEKAEIVGFSPAVQVRYPRARYFDEKRFVQQVDSEMDKQGPVFVDCRSGQYLGGCEFFARALVQKGFREVKTIGARTRRSVCPSEAPLKATYAQDEPCRTSGAVGAGVAGDEGRRRRSDR